MDTRVLRVAAGGVFAFGALCGCIRAGTLRDEVQDPGVNRGPFVSVAEYGAAGDGEQDDARAVQKAIDAAAGRPVIFPPGIYLIENTLLLPDNTHLVGRSATLKGPVNSDGEGGHYPTRILQNADPENGNMNISIEGLVLDGDFNGRHRRAVEDMKFTDNMMRLIRVDGLRLINLELTNTGSNWFRGPERETDESYEAKEFAALVIEHSRRVEIESLYMHRCWVEGVRIHDSEHVVIDRFFYEDVDSSIWTPLKIIYTDHVKMTDSVLLTTSRGSSLQFEGSHGRFQRLTIIGGGNGLEVSNETNHRPVKQDNVVIADSYIHTNNDAVRRRTREDKQQPIRGLVIQNCFLVSEELHSVMLGDFDGITIENCTLSSPRGGILLLARDGKNAHNLTVRNNTFHARDPERDSGIIRVSNRRDESGYTAASNWVFENNRVSGRGKHGVDFSGLRRPELFALDRFVLRGNTFSSGSGEYGRAVEIQRVRNAVIEGNEFINSGACRIEKISGLVVRNNRWTFEKNPGQDPLFAIAQSDGILIIDGNVAAGIEAGIFGGNDGHEFSDMRVENNLPDSPAPFHNESSSWR